MKKTLVLLGIMMLAFSLIACGGSNTGTVTTNEPMNESENTETEAVVEATATETEVSDEEELAVGKKIPNYELTTLEGETVSLHDYDGKIILLNFWATW
jgi:hypothetical protein